MARYHWWSFLLNEEGQPIEGASISVYLAGTETPAFIFQDEFSGIPNNTAPQVTSQENGYFEFWIPDVDEPSGYDPTQKFKIYWEKVGITKGYVDYVDVFPPTIPVNELDDNKSKTKTVSNFLANLWETHRLDTSHVVHGIEEVNEDNKDDVEKNKLISSFLAYKWDGHVDSQVNDVSTFKSENAYPHNIKQLDLSQAIPDDQYEYNRVISFIQGKKWDIHVNKNYNESPHNIEQVDETDSDETRNKLVSNELLRFLYSQSTITKRFDIFSSDWFTNSDGKYQVNIQHNLNEDFPLVQVWDLYSKEILNVEDIGSIDAWNIKLINNLQLDLKVIISS